MTGIHIRPDELSATGKVAISKTTSLAWNSVPGVPSMPKGGVRWAVDAGKDGYGTYQDVQQADRADR